MRYCLGELRAAKISRVRDSSEATKGKTMHNGSCQHLRASCEFSKGELGRTIPQWYKHVRRHLPVESDQESFPKLASIHASGKTILYFFFSGFTLFLVRAL